MEEIRQKVDDLIEEELTRHVTIVSAIEDPVLMTAELIEHPYAQGDFMAGESLRPALDILMPKLLNIKTSNSPSIADKASLEKIMIACQFAGKYHSIRDYIYYSYAIPETIS